MTSIQQATETKKVYRPPHRRMEEANNLRQQPKSTSSTSYDNNNNNNNNNGKNQTNNKHNFKNSKSNDNHIDNNNNSNDDNNNNNNNNYHNTNNNKNNDEYYSNNGVENLDTHADDNNGHDYDDNYDNNDDYTNKDNDNNNNNNTSYNRNFNSRFSNYNSRFGTHRNNNEDDNSNSRYHYGNNNNNNNNNNNSNKYDNYNRSTNNNRFGSYNRFNSNNDKYEEEEDLESELFKDENHEMVQGINFAQYDRIPVEISGEEVPPPISSFEESSLCEILLNNVKRFKYSKPTPIQKYAIPCVLHERDIMACAQTGSGKTAAFLLPIIHQLYQLKVQPRRYSRCCMPSAVVLAPTRELAIQIHVQARKFLFESNYRSLVVYGGAEIRKQMFQLNEGCEVLVATPGRLNDFLERQQAISLEQVKFCVLDEADRMLDMGFMPQIEAIIHDMPSKKHRNTLMFSATFPLEVQRLAQDFLDNYIFIAIGRVGSTTSFIKQKLRYTEEGEKLNALLESLSSCEGLKLIFVEKKRDATIVERELLRAGFEAISIHGDRTQKEREHALQVFRTARVPILVATDVAARGLDIPNVMWVFNFDLPNNIDSYVHRIGRTGRCGNEGNAVAFVNENNKPILKDLLKLLKETKQEIPQWFADLVAKAHPSSQFNGYGNKKYGQYGFGSRDYRTQKYFGNNNNSSNNNDYFKKNGNYDNNDMNNNYSNNSSSNNNNGNISYRREYIQNPKAENNNTQSQNWQNDSW